ncbi:Ig-like domain repeat protein [Nocardioides acrostichi]|uniref:Ig-like domain repeat protein n=1 Tax=Nocardioides acrostichi TaxID=2784339 RepID=A0A930V533_9ACTN|nr:Ig-like domain repeat protein [Nocardioides acrostichi]MBF4163339.1 Ig-like domain repeat protein [Nocardioides acrostichi]
MQPRLRPRAGLALLGILTGSLTILPALSTTAAAASDGIAFGDLVVTDTATGVHHYSADLSANDVVATGTYPMSAIADAAGNVYFSDYYGNSVSKVAADGSGTTTLAAKPNAKFPRGLALDDDGNVLFSDFGNYRVASIDSSGTVTKLVGSTTPVDLDAIDGDIVVADQGANSVYRLNADGTKTVLSTAFDTPQGVTEDSEGNVYVTDLTPALYKIAPDGTQTVLSTQVSGAGIALDDEGDVLNADYKNGRIVSIAPDGTMSVVVTGLTDPRDVFVQVTAPVFSASDATTDARVGEEYSYTYAAGYTGTTSATPRYEVSDGDLPPGLSLDADSGTLSGTPTASGEYTFTVSAFNSRFVVPAPETTITVGAAKTPQTITFTSTAPTSPKVGDSYTPTATGGDSGNPVVFSVATASKSVCSVSDAVVSFDAAGTCKVLADQAGSDDYDAAATVSQSMSVTAADSTVAVSVSADTLTATVRATDSQVDPTGTVDFSVDGTQVGSAQVSDGVATLTYTVPTGAKHTVSAAYSGDAAHAAATGSTTREDPSITALVGSGKPASSSGWFTSKVTVSFTCTGGTGTYTCPDDVVLGDDGAGQSAQGSVQASDGGADSVTVSGIDIDRTAPRVLVRGVKAKKTYSSLRHIRCAVHDAVSGADGCKVRTHRTRRQGRPDIVRYVVVGKDVAGNVTRKRGFYKLR